MDSPTNLEDSPPGGLSIVALVGPTAVGKSEVSLRLAEMCGAVIVSADSMQVYQGMDVGTAKPSPEDRAAIRHYLIDVVEASRVFSVADYVRQAEKALEECLYAERRAIVCGGTGYYVTALIDGICDSPPGDPDLRHRLAEEARQLGPERIHERLRKIDPQAAAGIHPNNLRRTIRALEVYYLSGQCVTALRQAQLPTPWGPKSGFVGLVRPWTDLDSRIEARVRDMMANGFLDEVRALLGRRGGISSTATQAIGYRELARHLAGEMSLEEAVEEIIRATRRFSRRQMTWWRRDARVKWMDVTGRSPGEVAREVAGKVGWIS